MKRQSVVRFGLQESDKEIRYILPLICDWISTVQETEVEPTDILENLKDGVILCKILSMIPEAGLKPDAFHDFIESDTEINENLDTFQTICREKLHFPVCFEQADLSLTGSYDDLLCSENFATVVETLCYLAKSAENHVHLKNQMPPELASYLDKNVPSFSIATVKPTPEKRNSVLSVFRQRKPSKQVSKTVQKPQISEAMEKPQKVAAKMEEFWLVNYVIHRPDLLRHVLIAMFLVGLISGAFLTSLMPGRSAPTSTFPSPCKNVNEHWKMINEEGTQHFFCITDSARLVPNGVVITVNEKKLDEKVIDKAIKSIIE